MKRYEVGVYKTVCLIVRVNAESESDALDVAMDEFCGGCYDGQWDDAETMNVETVDALEVEPESEED